MKVFDNILMHFLGVLGIIDAGGALCEMYSLELYYLYLGGTVK